MQRHLLIVLALFALAAPGAAWAEADDAGEALPWWAAADYPEEEVADAEPGPAALADAAEAVPEDPADDLWWAGGDDAVLVLAGGQPVEDGEAEGSVEPLAALSDAEPSAGEATDDSEGDDGRNPLFWGRPEGHRAGEEPPGGTTEDLEDKEVVVEEKRGKDDDAPCNRLPKQIARYEAQLDDAKDRDDERAESILEAHVDRLKARKEQLCPEYEGPSTLEKTIVVAAKLAKIAARVARYMYGSPF